ncbi:MAG: MBL fold metallo-hydrolase [Anaerolineae bacterium]|nr:MBL fold metallo-hydrolase [Anaerolineae bacterium]
MRIKWYGHACFRITSEDGRSIVTDPYTPETAGYEPISEAADIVIVSSDNDTYHCRADLIPGQPVVVNALALALEGGHQVVNGFPVQAIKAMEALDHHEHDPDQNGMYRFEVDGIHVGHLGDVGNPLTDEQMRFFSGIDVLLALAGGHPTIALDDLYALIERVRPRMVIPMHFRTLRYKPRNTFWIQSFLNYFDPKDVDFACKTEIALSSANLSESTRVMVLTHAC